MAAPTELDATLRVWELTFFLRIPGSSSPLRAFMAVGEAIGEAPVRGVVDAAIVKNREQQEPPTAKQAQALPAPVAVVQEEPQDPPVHHSQAEAAAAAAVARSEAEPPKSFKPAWQCGTPGCNLPNFHQGPHTCQQVVGPRQRRRSVRAPAAAAESEGPAVAAKRVRKKRAAHPSEETETHEALPEEECPTAAVACPVASADVMQCPSDRLVSSSTNPDPRRTDFLVRLFVFGHT